MAEQNMPQDASRQSKAPAEREGPGVERNRLYDTVNRTEADTATPRRYEQPLEDDDDPVMPGVDATLNTKI